MKLTSQRNFCFPCKYLDMGVRKTLLFQQADAGFRLEHEFPGWAMLDTSPSPSPRVTTASRLWAKTIQGT